MMLHEVVDDRLEQAILKTGTMRLDEDSELDESKNEFLNMKL
jgi:hypothetical protein